jgi:hypothetical protein
MYVHIVIYVSLNDDRRFLKNVITIETYTGKHMYRAYVLNNYPTFTPYSVLLFWDDHV